MKITDKKIADYFGFSRATVNHFRNKNAYCSKSSEEEVIEHRNKKFKLYKAMKFYLKHVMKGQE